MTKKENKILPFGGFNIIFTGDFFQLPPVKSGQPLWKVNTAEWGCVDVCIYLDTPWRFKDDKKWGDILLRCRRANYIPHEVDHINTRIVNNKDVVLQDKNIDGSLAYVCPTNHERNALADNIF